MDRTVAVQTGHSISALIPAFSRHLGWQHPAMIRGTWKPGSLSVRRRAGSGSTEASTCKRHAPLAKRTKTRRSSGGKLALQGSY
jgi:hypothetical protein